METQDVASLRVSWRAHYERGGGLGCTGEGEAFLAPAGAGNDVNRHGANNYSPLLPIGRGIWYSVLRPGPMQTEPVNLVRRGTEQP